jgi:2-oxo-4-hydroxy-4-carboxy--5-ureidoimidazoline (OHCU) decarboxylase
MLKKMMMKQMIKSQMKGMSEADQKKAMEMVDKNPDLFEKIAKETKELVDGGLDQMSAAMKVAQKYKDELSKLT